MDQDRMEKCKKENWLDVWFAIEILAVKEDLVKDALEEHIELLEKVKGVHVYKKDFKDVIKVENPIKNIDVAFSCVAEVKLFVKDIQMLIAIILTYGPSAVEILGPNSKEMKIDEIQNISNLLAGFIHQYASAGMGGIVITPDRKKH